MYLKKYNSVSRNENGKNHLNNLYPFSFFKIPKVKKSFSKLIKSYEEKEKKYMTLFGIRLSNSNNKIISRNKKRNKSKNFQKSLSNSSMISNLKKLFSLNLDKKNSLFQINPMDLKLFPHIQRNLRRYTTNIAINTNNINNIKFDNLFLNRMIDKKRKTTLKNAIFKSSKSPFITDIKEIKEITPNNSKLKNNKNIDSSDLILNEMLSGNIENNKLKSNNFFNFNNHFSFNKLNSINSPKSLKLNSFSCIDLKNDLKTLSNKSLMNIKSSSKKKTQIIRKDKFNEFNPSLSEKNLILKNINNQKNKDKNERSSLSSLKNQDSDNSSADLNSISNNNDNNKVFNNDKAIRKRKLKKNKKKIFNLMFKDKIFDLQKEIDKCSKEQEKNEDEYNLYIKYMIKKCKFIYDLIDTNFTFKIPESEYDIKNNEISKFIDSIDKENKNKKRKAEFKQRRFQILKNEYRIKNLANENNNLNRRIIKKLQKFLEKNNFINFT